MSFDATSATASGSFRALPTKLFAPRQRQGIVAREHLVQRIEQGRARPLTLVVAPAGFGKSTLVSQWLSKTKIPVSWLSLDAADNDPLHFLSYLLASLGRIRPEVSSKLDGISRATGDIDLRPLLAETLIVPLAEEDDRCALVLDDFHELNNPRVIEAVSWLLDNLPPCMHVVITSREEPALALPTRRASDDVTELGISDLAFSDQEATTFFGEAMGLTLDSESILSMRSRTEGWIAGMQLAGLSLKQGASIEDVLDTLASDSNVADYLVEEILDALEPSERSFLLDSSVLDRLCAPLCEAVVDAENASEALRVAFQAGLFLVPLDHRRQWYRYHHLFGELLRRRLRQEAPEREAVLQSRAAKWWMTQNDPHAAARYAIASGEHDVLGEIVEGWGLEALYLSDRPSLETWLAALPDHAMDRYPAVGVVKSWLAVLPVRSPPRVDAAVDAIGRSRAAMDATHVSAERRALLEGHLLTTESIATRPAQDLAACIAHAQTTLGLLSQDAGGASSVLALQIGVLNVMVGKPDRAIEPLGKAATWGEKSGNLYAGIAAMGYGAWAHQLLGQLDEADQACASAMGVAEKVGTSKMGLVGHIHVEHARVLFERWLLPEALDQLEEAIPRIRLLRDPFLLTTALALQARIRSAASEPELALQSCDEAEQVARTNGHPLLQMWAKSAGWSLALVRDAKPETPPPVLARDYRCVMHEAALYPMLFAINEGPAEQILTTCTDLWHLSKESGWMSHALDWSVVRALALHARGHSSEASEALTAAIAQGQARGIRRPFAEWLPTAHPLRGKLSENDQAFLSPLSTRERPHPPAVTAVGVPRSKPGSLAEGLSPRELEVLMHVKEGMTNPEIATTLFVSTGTVKTHMHRLLTKLQAKNRTDAVRIADEHGLFHG